MMEDLCPTALYKSEKCNLLGFFFLLFFFLDRRKYASSAAVEHNQNFRRNATLAGLIAHAGQITWLGCYTANNG